MMYPERPEHPIQPAEVDAQGILRFKQNAIVVYLIETCAHRVTGDPIDLNHLVAHGGFSAEDWEQFDQLAGWSVDGAPHVSDDVRDIAKAFYELRHRGDEGSAEYDRAETAIEDKILAPRRELRLLRAAQTPGSDDACLAPWVVDYDLEGSPVWRHPPTGRMVWRNGTEWMWTKTGEWTDFETRTFVLDAMRIAVPGSV